MPAPNATATLGDLLLTLGMRAAMVDSGTGSTTRPTLPTDEYTRKLLLDAVTRSVQHMVRVNDWTFCSMPVEIVCNTDGTGPENIDGDPSRMGLPFDVTSAPLGGMRWLNPDQTYGGLISFYDAGLVENRMAVHPAASGRPMCAAIRPVRSASSSQRYRYELVVWPIPDQAYVIKGRFRVSLTEMMDLAQRPPWPPEHDETVLAGAMKYLRMSGQVPIDMDPLVLDAEFTRAIDQSKLFDSRAQSSALGSFTRRERCTYVPPNTVDLTPITG